MRATEVDDGFGAVRSELEPIGQRWAKKTDINDGERIRAAQNGQEVSSRFLVRHDVLTSTITGKDAIVCEGRTYEIVDTKEYGGRRVGIEITATARADVQA